MDGIDVRLMLIVAGIALLGLFVYFLPWFVAIGRGHRNATAIGVLVLLLGWSFVPWVIALVWAFTVSESPEPPNPVGHSPGSHSGRGLRVAGAIALVVLLPAGLIGLAATMFVAASPTAGWRSTVNEWQNELRDNVEPIDAELARIDRELEEVRAERMRLMMELAKATVDSQGAQDAEVRETAQEKSDVLTAQLESLQTLISELEAKRAEIAVVMAAARNDGSGTNRVELSRESNESLERLRSTIDDIRHRIEAEQAADDLQVSPQPDR